MQSNGEYKVNEVFDSLQGEGSRVGWPSTFLRLQGCPVGCPWCDTKYTWSDGTVATWDEIEAKTGDEPTDRCVTMPAAQLVRRMVDRSARHVVITGGEPALYDLLPLTNALQAVNIETQIETSGTHKLSVAPASWVTCSPKLGMPGNLGLRPDVLERADEIKMPVGKQRDVDRLREKVLPFTRKDIPIYLQPLSCSSRATALCHEQARLYGWRVSIQLHKSMGLR